MSRKAIVACLAVLASVFVGTPAMTQTLDKVKVIFPQNSGFVLNWMGGKDAGIFEKHGIDLEPDARPFAGFLAGMPSKAAMVGTYAGMDAVEKMNQGVEWAVIGGGMTVFHGVFVAKDSPIKTVADLKGKKFGVWSTGAGTFKAVRAALIDAHGLDIAKDTEIVQLAPPALFKLLGRGDIDAMLNISSFTVKAMSQPDKYRSIFNPNAYWKKKTGYPIVWTAPLVAWTSWVKEDPDRAKRLAKATMESFKWLEKPENLDTVIKNHGKLAGVTDPAAVAVYKKLLAEQELFLTEWTQEAVDAQWQFLELAKEQGVLDKVPPKADHALLVNK